MEWLYFLFDCVGWHDVRQERLRTHLSLERFRRKSFSLTSLRERSGKPGWGATPLPQHIELQRLPGCRSHPENDFASRPHQLGGAIDYSSTHRRGIGGNRYHPGANIFFEAFEQEERHRHEVIISRIRRKPFKGKLFVTEVLESPMHQLIDGVPDLCKAQVGMPSTTDRGRGQ